MNPALTSLKLLHFAERGSGPPGFPTATAGSTRRSLATAADPHSIDGRIAAWHRLPRPEGPFARGSVHQMTPAMSNSVPSIGETSRTPVTLASTRSGSRGEVLLLTRSSGIHLPDVAATRQGHARHSHITPRPRSWSRVPESALGPRARTYDLITVSTLGRAHTPVDLDALRCGDPRIRAAHMKASARAVPRGELSANYRSSA
jgi:hypothetical protein